jgi:RNA polymerase sigma factor (sigma-70 family)
MERVDPTAITHNLWCAAISAPHGPWRKHRGSGFQLLGYWFAVDEDVDLVELTTVIRRTLRPRTSDQHLIEDITQETMLRVAVAQRHLEPQALRAYAIVTARNGFNAHLRNQSIATRHAHRVVDYTTLEGAEELTLEREENDALAHALGTLDEADRRLLLDHEVDELSVTALAAREGTSSGAIAMRLARARATLRLEFLLAFRRVTLTNARCRQVLLAISTGDQRHQGRIGVAEHLVSCEDCAELSQPLMQRRRGAAAWWFLPMPAWLSRLGRRARTSRPAQAVAVLACAAVLAAVVFGVVHRSSTGSAAAPTATTVAPAAALATSTSTSPATTPPAAIAQSVATTTPPTTAVASGCPPIEAITSIQAAAGCRYTLANMIVTEVPADEGFWITFTDNSPIWVHLVGTGESPQHVRPGEHVTLQATVTAASAGASSGIPADQTARLDARPFYLSVAFADLQVVQSG